MKKRSRTKKALTNVWVHLIGQILIFASVILLPKIVISNYGSDTNGLISTINQVFAYVGLVETGIAVSTVNALYACINKESHSGINTVLRASRRLYRRASIIYALSVAALAVILPFTLKTSVDKPVIALIILLQGAANILPFITYSPFSALLQAEGNGYILTVASVGTRLAQSVAKLVIYSLGANIIVVQIVGLAISIVRSASILFFCKKKYAWITYAEGNDGPVRLKGTVSYTLSTLANTVNSSTDVILLSLFHSTVLASVYAVYSLIFSTLYSFAQSFLLGNFAIGQVYQGNRKRYEKLHRTLETVVVLIIAALFSIATATAIPFIRIYTSGVTDIDYIDVLLPFLFSGIYFITVAGGVSHCLLEVSGHHRNIATFAVIEAAVNIGLSIPLVIFFGIRGVLVATLVAVAIKTIGEVIIANKKVLGKNPWISFRLMIASALLMVGIGVLFSALDFQISGYLGWIVFAASAALVIVLVFVLLGFLLAPQEMREAFNYLFGTLRKNKAASLFDLSRQKIKPQKKIAVVDSPRSPLIHKWFAVGLFFVLSATTACGSFALGKQSYQVQFHEKMLVADSYHTKSHPDRDEWFSMDFSSADGLSANDVIGVQLALRNTRPNLQSYYRLADKSFFTYAGEHPIPLFKNGIDIVSVATYTDKGGVMESISLPLYSDNSPSYMRGRNGADAGCYVSEFVANEIIANDTRYSTIDELIEAAYILQVDTESMGVLTFSINNVYCASKPPYMSEKDYDAFIAKYKNYPEYFVVNNKGAIFTYKGVLMSGFEKSMHVDALPTYGNLRNGIQRSFGLDYGTKGISLKLDLVGADGQNNSALSDLDLDSSALGSSLWSGCVPYLIALVALSALFTLLLTLVVTMNIRGPLFVAIGKMFAFSLSPTILIWFVMFVSGFFLGTTSATYLLTFNIFGNAVMATLGILAFLTALIAHLVRIRHKGESR